jgi:hypothetical protein
MAIADKHKMSKMSKISKKENRHEGTYPCCGSMFKADITLTGLEKAPFPVCEVVHVLVGICVNEIWEPSKIGVQAVQSRHNPIVILEVAIRCEGHGAPKISSNELHISG